MRNESNQEKARLELASGIVEIDLAQFEQIKQSTVSYINGINHDFREEFTEELQSGNSMIDSEGTWQHGAWQLMEKDDRIALVRYPPRSEVMYIFIAFLENRDGRWQVASFEMERMWRNRR